MEIPKCPVCGGDMWDNRAKKTNPKNPDFSCKNKECTNERGYHSAVWLPKEKKTPRAPQTTDAPVVAVAQAENCTAKATAPINYDSAVENHAGDKYAGKVPRSMYGRWAVDLAISKGKDLDRQATMEMVEYFLNGLEYMLNGEYKPSQLQGTPEHVPSVKEMQKAAPVAVKRQSSATPPDDWNLDFS